MKKVLALIALAALVLGGTTSARADLTVIEEEIYNPSFLQSETVTVSATGFTFGDTFEATASAAAPAGFNCYLMILQNDSFVGGYYANNSQGAEPLAISATGGYSTNSMDRPPVTIYATLDCWNPSNSSTIRLKSRGVRATFVSPVDAVTNFSVFPQASGTAFTTWSVANGATEYTVTATPGNRTCTTAQNFCVISGLTPGESYNFSVVATDGTFHSSSVSSGPVVLREPVTVGVGLNGGTWRVGDVVTAQYAIQGSTATPTITWYRCPTGVGTMPTPPPAGECVSVGSGASYALTSGDVGKYVTAHVFINNTDPQGQMTALSMNAVLAAGATAPAPVADPEGKPTVANIPNPIVSVAGGTEVTITGTGLSGVTSVTVGGLPATVISKTDTTIVVQVPISTKIGVADLVVTNDKGSVTSKSAIIYTTNPVIKVTKTKTITGFKAGQKVLTAAQKSAVKALITANSKLTILSCAAKTTGVASSKAELAKAKALATATCAYAKTLNKSLVTSVTASQTLPKSKASRTVALTLKN